MQRRASEDEVDNLKAAVSRADRYEPVLNENYRKLARHYNTAVIPA